MKKFISMISALILISSFTACNGNTIGESESVEFNQEVADATVSMLDEYYQGMRDADFDLTFKNYPEFYVDNVELELEYYGGTKDEYISTDNASYYNDNYGEDATISVDVKSTTLMTKAVTKKYNKLVTKLYKGDETIQSVYTVVVDKVVSGSLKEDSLQETWTIFEIDNSYYLYDDYFERLADTLSSTSEENESVTVTIS